ncbi:MAG: septum formation initiator family protein [Chloroflexi bacterium]|nr:septum formation initiator family protein [Chloroflexota bacterium]
MIAVLAQGVSNGVALWQRKQVLMTEIAARRAETTELEQRKQFAQTDDFVEIVARRELKMLRPGEVAVIPLLPVSAQPAIKDR